MYPNLNEGQKVAFINISDSPANISDEKITSGKKIINNFGFDVEIILSTLGDNVTAKDKATEFNTLVQRKDIGCIICTSGGSTTISILKYIDFEMIKKNPKVIMGTSDCSHLLQAIAYKSDLVTIDGPVVNRLEECPNKGIHAFADFCINNNAITYSRDENWHVLSPGTAKGKSWVGNDIITSSMLSLLQVDNLNNTILFIENHSGEDDAMVQYWMSILDAKGYFQQISGVVFGTFITDDAQNTAKNIFDRFLSNLNIPVLQIDLFGNKNYYPMPIGANCSINTDLGEISFYRS